MKKLIILAAMVFSTSAFALGAFEKYDFSTGTSPVGYTLGEVCYDQGSYISTVSKSVCAKKEEVFADEDQKYRLNPRMRKTCVAWDKVAAGKVLPGTKNGCIEWVRKDLSGAEEGLAGEDSNNNDYEYVCVATGPVEVKRTQRLDTYISNGPSYSDRQNSGSAMFTVPACSSDKDGDLPDEDVPDSKK